MDSRLFSIHVERRGRPAPSASSASAVCGWLVNYRRGRPAHCFVCDRRLRRVPSGIIVMLPCDGEVAITGGVCPRCLSGDDSKIIRDALPAIRLVMPDARLVDRASFLAKGGRA